LYIFTFIFLSYSNIVIASAKTSKNKINNQAVIKITQLQKELLLELVKRKRNKKPIF
jgi:hypothetical protein